MPKSAQTRKIQKGWCNKPTKPQFQGSLNTERQPCTFPYEPMSLRDIAKIDY